MTSLTRSVQRSTRTKGISGIIRDILGNKCSVALSTNGKVLVGIPFTGAAPSVGDIVIVDFKTASTPIAITNIPPVSAEPEDIASLLTILPPQAPADELPSTKLARMMTLCTKEGTLSTGETPLKIYNKYGTNRYIVEVFLSVGTAPTGDDIIVDILVDGVSIFASSTDMPTILAGETTGTSITFEDPNWPVDTALTWDIFQVGSGTAGANLVIHVVHDYGSITTGSGSGS